MQIDEQKLQEILEDLTAKTIAISNSPVFNTQMKRWAKAEQIAKEKILELLNGAK